MQEVPGAAIASPARGHLDHVDAMRPVKQLGVLATHSMLFFAPSIIWINASVTLLHVSREGFLFISACMVTYAYYDMSRSDLKHFWQRRLTAVGLPYLCWTLIYFAIGLQTFRGSAGTAFEHLGYLLLTGYFQLYFLVVLIQFYVLFPAVVWLLKRTSGRHIWVLAISFAIQVGYTFLLHWQVIPEGTVATREVMSYQFYLLAGCLTAIHYKDVNAWLLKHARLVLLATIATGTLIEGWYWLALKPSFAFLGSSSDAFHPIVIPFNIAAIGLIYLAGVGLVSKRRSTAVRHATRLGSDNSYAIYLSQALFLTILGRLGWSRLNHVIPWPLEIAAAVAIVFVCGCILGGILARTPLAMPLAGRHRVSWRSLRPWWLYSRREVALPIGPAVATYATRPENEVLAPAVTSERSYEVATSGRAG